MPGGDQASSGERGIKSANSAALWACYEAPHRSPANAPRYAEAGGGSCGAAVWPAGRTHAPALRVLACARTAATQCAKEPEANLLSMQAEAAAGQLLDRVATAHAEYATQRGALAAQLKSLAGEVAMADAAAAAAAEARAALGSGPGSKGLDEAAVRARMAATAADARLHEAAIAAQEARPWMRRPSFLFSSPASDVEGRDVSLPGKILHALSGPAELSAPVRVALHRREWGAWADL